MRDLEPGLVEAGEQEAGVAIAHVESCPRRVRQVRERGLGDAVGAIAAAREPDGVDRRVGHHFAQRRQPRLVGAGEMAVGQKALRMDRQARSRRARRRSPRPRSAASRFSVQLGATTAIFMLCSSFEWPSDTCK